MNLGNTTLVDYGIQNEQSDIRIHVAVYAQKIYIYKTSAGYQAIKRGNFPCVPVYTNGIQTATGYLVPPKAIEGCQEIPIPEETIRRAKMSTYTEWGDKREKGQAAVFIVTEMLKHGQIPIQLQIVEIDDQKMQILGEDIHVNVDVRIQVKCDYRAGIGPHPRCTGNLFLQIQECNPFNIH